MKLLFYTIVLLNCCSVFAAIPSFKFHLLGEPYNVDPALIRGSSGSYLFTNIYRSLYTYDNEKGLVPEGASRCQWINVKLYRCQLNHKMKWSNGTPVLAADYVRAWRRLVDPRVKSLRSELLLNVKNGKKILNGQMPSQKLGVVATEVDQLDIHFDEHDPEFAYKLTYPAMAPIKMNQEFNRDSTHLIVTNGPYKILKWQRGRKITLVKNKYYWKNLGKPSPKVEVYFIEDDETAHRMFKRGQLSFLRRLPSEYIAQYKTHPGFLQKSVARFDYIGFGKELQKWPQLRKALSLSLKYAELKHIYSALGMPGCPSLPQKYMNHVHCHSFQLKEARSAFNSLPEEIRNKKWKFHFSKMGGTDIAKGVQWVQQQWKKHLNFNVSLQAEEQGTYLQLLKMNAPAIFRKGIGVDRPTCLAAIEIFSTNHPENYMKIDEKNLNKVHLQLAMAKGAEAKKKLCSKSVKVLMKNFLLIPLGEIHFTMLHDSRFTNWSINELNQLDLSALQTSQINSL